MRWPRSGSGSNTTKFEEAIVAYREALKTREREPLGWAATQNNLGVLLATLGARESGTAKLEEAVAAYRDTRHPYSRRK